jgi:hypothetical protein
MSDHAYVQHSVQGLVPRAPAHHLIGHGSQHVTDEAHVRASRINLWPHIPKTLLLEWNSTAGGVVLPGCNTGLGWLDMVNPGVKSCAPPILQHGPSWQMMNSAGLFPRGAAAQQSVWCGDIIPGGCLTLRRMHDGGCMSARHGSPQAASFRLSLYHGTGVACLVSLHIRHACVHTAGMATISC